MTSPADTPDIKTPATRDVFALFNSIERGSKQDVLDSLRRFGSSFANAASVTGTSALMLAAFYDRTDIMALLIENGADIEAKNRDGDTALIWALYAGKPDAALLLLDHGADVNVVNQMSKTPFDYAAKLDRADIINWMKTATPRNIERTIENGVQNPLPVHRPLRLRKG